MPTNVNNWISDVNCLVNLYGKLLFIHITATLIERHESALTVLTLYQAFIPIFLFAKCIFRRNFKKLKNILCAFLPLQFALCLWSLFEIALTLATSNLNSICLSSFNWITLDCVADCPNWLTDWLTDRLPGLLVTFAFGSMHKIYFKSFGHWNSIVFPGGLCVCEQLGITVGHFAVGSTS